MEHRNQRLLLGPCVLALSACTAPRMAAPADVSSSSDVLVVTERSQATGALVNEGFKLGPYTIADVDRKWDSQSAVSAGPWDKESKTTGYAFTLAGSGSKLSGKCQSTQSQQSVMSWGGSFDWGSATITCSCEGGADKISLVLSKDTNQLSIGGAVYPIQPIHGLEGGVEQSSPSGFRVDSDAPLGAVEVLYPGQVWLRKGLGEATRSSLSCLFTGLMLYKPPSDH